MQPALGKIRSTPLTVLQAANAYDRARGGPRTGPIMRSVLWRFINDDGGATAIEYGLIAAGIAVAIIAVVTGLGSQLNTTFSNVSGALK